MSRRHGAELVFVEDDRGGRWRGHLLGGGEVIDTTHDELVPASRPRATIDEWSVELRGGLNHRHEFKLTVRGGSKHGKRTFWHTSLPAAQAQAVSWARRRFKRQGG